MPINITRQDDQRQDGKKDALVQKRHGKRRAEFSWCDG